MSTVIHCRIASMLRIAMAVVVIGALLAASRAEAQQRPQVEMLEQWIECVPRTFNRFTLKIKLRNNSPNIVTHGQMWVIDRAVWPSGTNDGVSLNFLEQYHLLPGETAVASIDLYGASGDKGNGRLTVYMDTLVYYNPAIDSIHVGYAQINLPIQFTLPECPRIPTSGANPSRPAVEMLEQWVECVPRTFDRFTLKIKLRNNSRNIVTHGQMWVIDRAVWPSGTNDGVSLNFLEQYRLLPGETAVASIDLHGAPGDKGNGRLTVYMDTLVYYNPAIDSIYVGYAQINLPIQFTLPTCPRIPTSGANPSRPAVEMLEQWVECVPRTFDRYTLKVKLRNNSPNIVTHGQMWAVDRAVWPSGVNDGVSLNFLEQYRLLPGETAVASIDLHGAPGDKGSGRLAVYMDTLAYYNPAIDSIYIGYAQINLPIQFSIPLCGNRPPTHLVELLSSKAECKPGTSDRYIITFQFRNNSSHRLTSAQCFLHGAEISLVDPNLTLAAPILPGKTGTATLEVIGPAGANPILQIATYTDSMVVPYRQADGSTTYANTLGIFTLNVALPECAPHSSGCFELVEQTIECSESGWAWCFSVRNLSRLTLNRVIANGIGQTFARPVPAGQVSERVCIALPGGPNGYPPGTAYIEVKAIGDSLGVYCYDSLALELPRCDSTRRNCCDGFIINFASATPVAAPNGLTGLLGLIGAGPSVITKVSATIVSASVNGQPGFAYFNSGTILNPLGAGVVTPPPFGQEIIWNSNAGVTMNAPSLFLNWLRLPPMAPNARRDTATFCIRWRFTDVNCRTCDTMICYRVARNQFFFNTTGTSNVDGKESSILGIEGRVTGQLTGQNSGSLSITFPELPKEEFGDVSFTGLRIQADDNVRIANVTSSNPVVSFTTQFGLASGSFNAAPGDQIDLNIAYENLGGRAALNHFLMVSYESSLLPGVEQQMPISVTLRQAGTATGGDQVEAVRVEVAGNEVVQTFALHLRNANTTGEALSGLRIVAGDGVKLLAVGPTSSETEALLRFGAEGEGGRAYVSEASEGTISLPAGSERNPIYITLSMNEEADPVIHFATLNGLDEVVSQGELNLSQISSVGGDGVTGTSISLGQSTPNPTTGDVSIGLWLTASERVSLVLRDANGREVMRLLEEELLTTGTHVVRADISSLSSGTYFYTLETASGSETRKLVIQK